MEIATFCLDQCDRVLGSAPPWVTLANQVRSLFQYMNLISINLAKLSYLEKDRFLYASKSSFLFSTFRTSTLKSYREQRRNVLTGNFVMYERVNQPSAVLRVSTSADLFLSLNAPHKMWSSLYIGGCRLNSRKRGGGRKTRSKYSREATPIGNVSDLLE